MFVPLDVAGNFLKDDTQANTGGENFEEIAGDNNILGEGTDAEKDEQDPQKIMENLRKAGVEFEVAGAPKPEVEQLNQEVQIQEISNHAEEQMQETKAELPKAVDDQKERELLQHAEKLLQEAEELTKNIDVQDGPVDTTTVTDMPSEAVTQAQLEVKADVIVETTIRKEEAVPDVASESVKVPIEVKESTSTTPALQVESSTKLQRHRKIANKIVAHKFDSRGESISEGDEGHHDKNCSQHAKNKGKNVAEKEKPARKRLVHGKKLESPETEVTEVDSKNQPSSESHGNSWSDEFFADDGRNFTFSNIIAYLVYLL